MLRTSIHIILGVEGQRRTQEILYSNSYNTRSALNSTCTEEEDLSCVSDFGSTSVVCISQLGAVGCCGSVLCALRVRAYDSRVSRLDEKQQIRNGFVAVSDCLKQRDNSPAARPFDDWLRKEINKSQNKKVRKIKSNKNLVPEFILRTYSSRWYARLLGVESIAQVPAIARAAAADAMHWRGGDRHLHRTRLSLCRAGERKLKLQQF